MQNSKEKQAQLHSADISTDKEEENNYGLRDENGSKIHILFDDMENCPMEDGDNAAFVMVNSTNLLPEQCENSTGLLKNAGRPNDY